jgi:hypothetical protein
MPVTPNSAVAASSNGSLVKVTLQPNPGDSEGIAVLTGTFTGVQGTLQGSLDGVTYVGLTAVNVSSGGSVSGTLNPSGTPTAYWFKVGGWPYIQFNPTQVSTGTVTITLKTAGTLGGTPPGGSSSGGGSIAQTITSVSANAFTVGPNGVTNPAFNVDDSVSSAATGLNLQPQAAGSGMVMTIISSGTNESGYLTAKGTGSINIQGTTNPGFTVAGVASAATGLKITPAAAASGLAIATISSGTNENMTLDAKGSGTIGIGTISTGAITLGAATGVTGALTITSASASALTVGLNGATNPVLKVNAATATVATGLAVTGAAATAGLALAVISSGTNENLTLNAKGSGTITVGGVSTGNVVLGGGGGIIVCPGTLTAGGLLTNAIQVATSGPLIYSGSGAPSISAAVKGSLYLRSDGTSTSTRAYVASDTAGTWTALTTGA